MGSSSKKSSSSKTTTPAAPNATQTGLPEGVSQQYYTDLNQVPTTGGLVLPTTGVGGPTQGAGLNWYTPPTRSTLASTINSGNGGVFNAGNTYGVHSR